MSNRVDDHAAEHALAIAALQAGDLAGPELARAEGLRTSCAACAALHADLGTLRSAVRTMPVPPRWRDYRLTEADAARLRPTGWRRLLEWLAAPGSSVRPLATGLATLGIAGLLLTGLPGLSLFGSTASAPVPVPAYQVTMGPADIELATGAPSEPPKMGPGSLAVPTQAPAATAAPAMGAAESPAAEPSAGEGITGAGQKDSSANRSATPDESSRDAAQRVGRESADPSFVALASLVRLAAGLGLFGARWAVRARA